MLHLFMMYSKGIQLYIYTHSFFIFFSIMVHNQILNIVLCTIQQGLVYRVSVLQDEKSYGNGEWVYNTMNAFNTTELYS